jgi:hypothetical protein|tara:strand:+ start:175 stop:342 length:168 start_codon:yes stop_codon:yes gene_type:complete
MTNINRIPKVYNSGKIRFIGIWNNLENYLQIDDYLGVNSPECTFEADVKDFLKKE